MENPETAMISVSRENLKDIMNRAKMGEGDIRHMNNPEMAAAQLNAIYQKVKEILGESDDGD